ncbi:MAG: hypothetical protein RBT62_06795 [Spirochaetia bacterium]|jgi:hypothetical protein|nr:hypothetical protein [Spirochaetia bacterium]
MSQTTYIQPAIMVAALALAACLPLAVFASPGAGPESSDKASAEYLYGIPSGLNLNTIIDKPLILGWTNYVFKDSASGEKRLGGYADVVAIYDISMQELLDVSIDFESYPSFVPRIYGTSILSQDGQRYRLLYNAGIKFLGLHVTYDSVFETVLEYLPDGGAGLRSWLIASLDDGSYEHFTSFYFCPVTVQGRTMTFMRYFNRPGIKHPSAGMLQVLNLFTPPEARSQVSAIAREAERRSGRR